MSLPIKTPSRPFFICTSKVLFWQFKEKFEVSFTLSNKIPVFHCSDSWGSLNIEQTFHRSKVLGACFLPTFTAQIRVGLKCISDLSNIYSPVQINTMVIQIMLWARVNKAAI